jgi:hypothetical protein
VACEATPQKPISVKELLLGKDRNGDGKYIDGSSGNANVAQASSFLQRRLNERSN